MIPIELQPMANHLWQSTLFCGVVGLLTLTLKSNGAATRYRLWFAASLKFLIPFSLLVTMGSQFERHNTIVITQSSLSSVVEHVSQPFTSPAPPPAAPRSKRPAPTTIVSVACAVWAIGFLVLVFSWWQRWRTLRAALRTATPLELPIDLRVLTSRAFPEPGVFGIRRPVLLLPYGIIDNLTPLQLEAILAHELCHVHRHDNASTAFHMTVEALFWFHPMVWWLGAKLMEERELACDEEVLRTGSEPEVYAESILKICELYLESPLQCVAGVTGANLKKRIEAIMANRIVPRLNLAKKVTLAVAGMASIAAPFTIGMMNPRSSQDQFARAIFSIPQTIHSPAKPGANRFQTLVAQNNPAHKLQTPASINEFDVASVKPSAPVPPSGGVFFGPPKGGPGTSDPERITWTYATVKGLLMKAYDVKAYQIIGPKWLGTERYDILVKVPAGATKEQVNSMWQNLLAERFGVTLHHELKEFQVDELVVAKGGPKVTTSLLDDPAEGPPAMDKDGKLSGPGMVNVISNGLNGPSVHSMAKAQPIARLTVALGNLLNRPVVDKTGLTGKYDFDLEFAPDSGILPLPPPLPGAAGPVDNAISRGPDLTTALKEQLGLRLVPSKANIDLLVIDNAEKVPTAN